MDFEGVRPPNFQETTNNGFFVAYMWLSSCWLTTFATPLSSAILPFFLGGSHHKMTINAVDLPPSTHSETHLVRDLHNDLDQEADGI